MDKIKETTYPIDTELNNLEQKLRALVSDNDNFLKKHLIEFLFASPKRLRPIFIFLFSKILKIEDENVIMQIALASELIHSASLIHDDIIDDEKTRRNTVTFKEQFGAKIAVLEGDLLLSMALSVLSKTSLEILKIYSFYITKTIMVCSSLLETETIL